MGHRDPTVCESSGELCGTVYVSCMIDPHRLRFLVEVAHWGTVTAAAESMGYSPSAASQQLAALQRDLDLELLERRGRNVALTPSGTALVARADAVFDALEAAETAARRAAERATGHVRIGALGSTIVDLLPLAVASLRAEAPRLDLQVLHLGDELLSELTHRSIDLAVEHRWSNVTKVEPPGVVARELCREPVFVVAHEDLDLSDPAVLADRAWIEHPCAQCGPATLDVIRRLGVVDPSMPFRTDDMTVMLHVAALGAAMPVVPALVCLHLPSGVRLWEVPGVHRTIAGYIRRMGVADPGLESVLDHLATAGRTLQDRFGDLDSLPLATVAP